MMVRYLATACLIYAALVLQSTFARDLAVEGIEPWFPGIALVACVALHEGTVSLVWAALLGLMVDSLSGGRMGPHTAITTCVATILLVARQDLRTIGVILAGIFVLCGTFVWRLSALLSLAVLERRSIDPANLMITFAGEGIYTSLLTIVSLLLLKLMSLKFRERESATQPVLKNQWTMLTK